MTTRFPRLTGLVAATHTPFHADGSLRLESVERQAAHLLAQGVQVAFIGGTTGESHSLSLEERLALGRRWADVVRGSALKVVVHVGTNCLADARELAAEAERSGAAAVAALSPSYFKPRTLDLLVDSLAEIAAAAPSLPFYYYDIPSFTGVAFPAADLLERGAERIPNLAGVKFTNPDFMAYQLCQRAVGGTLDPLWGTDEFLLGALAFGAKGAVGSTYNFAAPIYHRAIAAFERGDWESAREEQFKSVRMIQLLARYGYMGAAKATMGFLRVEVGPARLPNGNPTAEETRRLRGELETLGFFDWVGRR